MDLVTLVVVLVIVGVALYLVNLIPMAAPIKTIINVLVVLVVCIWILQQIGLLGSLHTISIR